MVSIKVLLLIDLIDKLEALTFTFVTQSLDLPGKSVLVF